MRWIYGALSVAGLLLPMVCFGLHFSRRGESAWHEFFLAPFATWVISGFTWDLLITATVATVWMKVESDRLKMTGFFWHLIAIFAVGICFALPTFLFRREAHLMQKGHVQN
jgi:mannose/fructose/N-acetylgalactosamine-specific phosphotransferase system component IIC